MLNKGVHSIDNLRACCADCNSSSGKGRIQFSDSTLDIHLSKSPKVTQRALNEQRRILRSGEVGKSAIMLASAKTDKQYELLWDLDVSQALVAALHRSSQVLQNGRSLAVPMLDAAFKVDFAINGKSARLLAAMQLASGLSLSKLAKAVVDDATRELDEWISRSAIEYRNAVFGVAAGSNGWAGALFTVRLESVRLEEDVVYYSCSVTFEENVSIPIVAQSSDGAALEDSQSDFFVEGCIYIDASTELGDYTRSSPQVDDIEFVDRDALIETL